MILFAVKLRVQEEIQYFCKLLRELQLFSLIEVEL